MKKLSIAAVLSLALSSPAAFADQRIKTRLTGYQEVPSVSTGASGELELVISRHNDFIDFELSYQGLQGVVRQAHIHFAQRHVNGAIVLWLCQTTLNPAPASVADRLETCPQEGTVRGRLTAADVVAARRAFDVLAGDDRVDDERLRGRLTAADVVGPQPPGTAATQQIVDGELEEVIAAIRAGAAYANVHTTPSPGGEIRGQIGNDRRGQGGKGR